VRKPVELPRPQRLAVDLHDSLFAETGIDLRDHICRRIRMGCGYEQLALLGMTRATTQEMA